MSIEAGREPDRIALAAVPDDALVICATARLARDMRREYDRIQQTRGRTRWPALATPTLAQWLDALSDAALLAGRIDPASAPQRVLSSLQERLLWEQVIADLAENADDGGNGSDGSAALFDRPGLAAAALDAHALTVVWDIRLPSPDGPTEQTFNACSEECRQFQRWQDEFRRRLAAAGWQESVRVIDGQIEALAAGALPADRLPPCVAFAGFDRYDPQVLRFARLLDGLGVAVVELEQGLAEPGEVTVCELPDRLAECRAAVAWASRWLAERPQARLGIVVPELAALRETLAALLDDVLDPTAIGAARAEAPRLYNFSLGLPLARQPLVDTALRLIRLAARPQRTTQAEFGELLRRPGWSADIAEADARALLDQRLREKLKPTLSVEQVLRFMDRHGTSSSAQAGMAGLQGLHGHLTALVEWAGAQRRRELPSLWAESLRRLLTLLGWPGERPLSSHEYQTRRAFDEALAVLAELDALLGRIDLATASRHLAQICRERIFQPKTEGEPAIEIMGLLEAAGTPLDGLWVMGMNDHLWPPPARPNPLLPAELQRRARAPNASAEVQGEFAAVIQRRLGRSAPQLIFSFAHAEGERELRPSPLMNGLPRSETVLPREASLAERLVTAVSDDALEWLDDHRGPPVGADEVLRGGTALLRAQAICPAWAFYRYRLAARPLETSVDGLDERDRGTLLHAVLQCFWQTHGTGGLASLQSMTAETLDRATADAVEQGLAVFETELDAPLAPRFRALEGERLRRLLAAWLVVELARPQPFTVAACEREQTMVIEGIEVRTVIDRIDRLDDGRHVVIDYKTGSQLSQASWGDARISEPQLPIYTAFGAVAPTHDENEVAAVTFARVRLDDCGFVGIAAETGVLQGVLGIAEPVARKLFPAQESWPLLLEHWQSSIAAIACEIRDGEAAVSFEDETALKYCDVLPILRLAERQAQLEIEMARINRKEGGGE